MEPDKSHHCLEEHIGHLQEKIQNFLKARQIKADSTTEMCNEQIKIKKIHYSQIRGTSHSKESFTMTSQEYSPVLKHNKKKPNTRKERDEYYKIYGRDEFLQKDSEHLISLKEFTD